ncbi:MAG: hypothetical protein KL787_10060, partial [Taibaiella sp.]|nr:hypothetical protein [Taibaiella sp.]
MVNIPKLSELYNSILADLQAELGVTIPLWTKSFIKILAMVQATKMHLAYLALGDVQRNIFPDTADPEAMGGTLERFGRVKIGRMPLTATQGKYIVQVTGDPGATIPVSSTMVTDDDSS